MNKALSLEELQRLETPLPGMTRREKLSRLASLLRSSTRTYFAMWNSIEYMHDYQQDALQHPDSIFAAAAADPILKDAGLANGTVGEAKRFFELSRDDLHVFSCDCGGCLSKDDMARRVDILANSR